MILSMSVFSLLCGGIMACIPAAAPGKIVIAERCSGVFLIMGLALIGSGLPLFR